MKEKFENIEPREIKPESKIGLNLSFCVRDILKGKITEEEIKEIITRTKINTPEEINEAINFYRATYWEDNPDEGEKIARRLFTAGKVKNPEIGDRKIPGINKSNWIEVEE